jgi:hypothetical protein
MTARPQSSEHLGAIWWAVVVACTIASAWLLLQLVFLLIPGGNAPQSALLLGMSLLYVGLPSLIAAGACLAYALYVERKIGRSPEKVRSIRSAWIIALTNTLIPLLCVVALVIFKYAR